MERPLANPAPKKWKNIIFVNEHDDRHTQGDQAFVEINAREAVAVLTNALADALREANQLPSKRTRLR